MRSVSRRLPILTLLLLLTLGTSGAADWYVDGNSVAGSPDGSPAHPYLTITDALNDPLFLDDDTVIVAPATYAENVVVDGIRAHLIATAGPTTTVIQGGGPGPAVAFYYAGPSTLSGFTITGGAAVIGGGVEVFRSSPMISRNIIVGNSATGVPSYSAGGGIDAYRANGMQIVGNLVTGNHAEFRGGGVHVQDSVNVLVSFNTIAGNTLGSGGDSYGSGIAIVGGSGSVANNVVAGNTADVAVTRNAGGVEVLGSLSVIEGSLLHQNLPEDFVVDDFVQALPDGFDNIAAPPSFVDEGSGDYHLRADSPAVDTAVAGIAPSEDLDGNPIPVDGDGIGGAQADRGCFEHLGSLTGLAVSAASVVSWDAAFTTPDAYHVYRGTAGGVAAGDAGACQDGRDGNLFDTQFTEPDAPAQGELFTFLAGFELRGARSGLGRASDGGARVPALACP